MMHMHKRRHRTMHMHRMMRMMKHMMNGGLSCYVMMSLMISW